MEYERLEMHYSYCYSLLHSRSNRPKKRLEEIPRPSFPETKRGDKIPSSVFEERQTAKVSNPVAERNIYRASNSLRNSSNSYQKEERRETTKQNQEEFNSRVDRHGNTYGERVGTKQTRNPPPEINQGGRREDAQTWKTKPTQELTHYNGSPAYSKQREVTSRKGQRGRDLFPQRSEGLWRPKQAQVPLVISENAIAKLPPRAEQETTGYEINSAMLPSSHQQQRSQHSQGRAKEAIMEDLHEVTRQYMSCDDPVEAAARRQRVLYTDANGLMEETAARILASTQRRSPNSEQRETSECNPVTPRPPKQDDYMRATLFPDPMALYNTPSRVEEEGVLERLCSEQPKMVEQENPGDTSERPARIRSLIVSPNAAEEELIEEPVNLCQNQEEEEPSRDTLTKIRRRSARAARRRPLRYSPNILRGASSKKRKLSQILNSPSMEVGPSERNVPIRAKQTSAQAHTNSNVAASSHTNPPVQLIPAIRKRNPDFRASPRPGPY